MFELYANQELIGVYPTRQSATFDAFELVLEDVCQTFEIIEIPPTP